MAQKKAPRKAPASKKALDYRRGKQPFLVPPEGIVMVTDPEHKLFDVRATYPADPLLVQSMLMFGWLDAKPAAVVKLTKEFGRDPVLEDGRRRLTAAVEANRLRTAAALEAGVEPILIEVPCVYSRGEDLGQIVARSIVANKHHRPEDPVSEAKRIRILLDTCKDMVKVAAATGYDPNTVSRRLKLLDLSPKLQAAIMVDKVGVTAALKVYKLDHDAQDAWLDTFLSRGKKPTGKDAQKTAGAAPPPPGKKLAQKVAQDLSMATADPESLGELPEGLVEHKARLVDPIFRAGAVLGINWAKALAPAPKE